MMPGRLLFYVLVLVAMFFLAMLPRQVAAEEQAKIAPKSSGTSESTGAASRRPSSAAERLAAATAARKLEADPLGPGADARRKTALLVLEAPDIQVKICVNMLASFANEKAPNHLVLLEQILFSTMAFMIERPEQVTDDEACYLAGVLGALKAYRRVLAAEPGSRSPFFDKLVKLQKRGAVEAYIRKESAACLPGR
jgi:hypothetical protein